LQFYDPEVGKSYVPYVIETSIGLDRMFLAVLSAALKEQQVDDKNTRTVLKIPAFLAPMKVAVLPLLKKDGLPELANEITEELQWETQVTYDDKDAVGRRYRRQDAAGTPYCITVDHQSLEDKTVTLRERDSMEQKRIAIDELKSVVLEQVSMINALKELA
jgi:glycyl-tRNA synthetase